MDYVDKCYHIIENIQVFITVMLSSYYGFTFNRNQTNRTIPKGVNLELSQYQK